jgi:hypothetical protein
MGRSENQDEGDFLRPTYSRAEESSATQDSRVEQSVRNPLGFMVRREVLDQEHLPFTQTIDEQDSQAELAIAQPNQQQHLEAGPNEAAYAEKEGAVAEGIQNQCQTHSMTENVVLVEHQGLPLPSKAYKPGGSGEEVVTRMNQVDMQRGD